MNEFWHAILEVWYGWHGKHWNIQKRHKLAAFGIPIFLATLSVTLWTWLMIVVLQS